MALANQAEAKAADYIAQAEKKVTGWGMWFKKSQLHEEAAELLLKAAAQYKIAKMWQEAGDIFVRAAEHSEKAADDTAATQAYLQAGQAYANVSAQEAIRYKELVVGRYMENNKFSMAARLHKDIGALYADEMQTQKAIDAYNAAADCYSAEDQTTSANQMRLLAADLMVQQRDYKSAIPVYEAVARESSDNRLTRWSVKDYIGKATLCRFALAARSRDLDELKQSLASYNEEYPDFANSAEGKLYAALVEHFEAGQLQQFTDAVFEYDQIATLDNFKSTILLDVKKAMAASEEKVEDGIEDVPDFA